MTTKLPLSMLKGKVVTAIRKIPSKTLVHFTDDTYIELRRDLDDEYEAKMTSLEESFNDHVHTVMPGAHTGNIDNHSYTLGDFQAIFRVVPTPPATIGMEVNTQQRAISQVFRVELELINKTGNTYSDIAFTIPAPLNFTFFDETAEFTLPAGQTVTGSSATGVQSYRGFELPPGQRGKFTVLAQQSFGDQLLVSTSLVVQCTDLEYRVSGGAMRSHQGLPLVAPYTVAP